MGVIIVMQGHLGPLEGVFNLLPSRVLGVPDIALQPTRGSARQVLSFFGALPRDNTDKRLVRELNGREGQWKFDKPEDFNIYSGIAPKDSDRDGMSDEFENKYGRDLKASGYDISEHYENLEIYLDLLVQRLLDHTNVVDIKLRESSAISN